MPNITRLARFLQVGSGWGETGIREFASKSFKHTTKRGTRTSSNFVIVSVYKRLPQASLQAQVELEDGKTESHASSARLEEDLFSFRLKSGRQRPRWMKSYSDSIIGILVLNVQTIRVALRVP
jgi:hypothetical protein